MAPTDTIKRPSGTLGAFSIMARRFLNDLPGLDKLAPPLSRHMVGVTAQPERDYRHQIPLQILHGPSLWAAMPNTKWGLILFDHFKHPNFKIQSIKKKKEREKEKKTREGKKGREEGLGNGENRQ